MLQSDQFQDHEAWILFKLNGSPIRTVNDGNFDLIVLMEGASGIIVGSSLISVSAAEPSTEEASRMLDEGEAYWQRQAQALYVPSDLPATLLTAEAERRGMTVVRVPENQLLWLISEPRAEFKRRLG